MNKAFVREPDQPEDVRCPHCGTFGQLVGHQTLESHLTVDDRRRLTNTAWFCPNHRCEVGYYDSMERSVPIKALGACVYPKDPDAPVCSCFGLKAEDIIRDARTTEPARVRKLIAHSENIEAQCHVRAPNGRSCVSEVQSLYLKHLSKSS